MTSKNDITGDSIVSKTSNKKYEEGWERIFGKKSKQQQQPVIGPAGLHIESGWADKERLEKIKKEQAQDPKNG